MERHIVIGLGEVGKALQEVLGCKGWDSKNSRYGKIIPKSCYKFMHICFPYSEEFKLEVKRYQKIFRPKYTIVHSTVPIGTCQSLGVLHSPVRGRHPDIVRSLKVFIKFVGGKEAKKVAEEFKSFGIPAVSVKSSRDTEALKLWDTTQYGVMILLNKEIKKFCDKYKLNFDVVYTIANFTYNFGYEKLGLYSVVRPYLEYMPGKIGGHCVVNNAYLLDSESARRLRG